MGRSSRSRARGRNGLWSPTPSSPVPPQGHRVLAGSAQRRLPAGSQTRDRALALPVTVALEGTRGAGGHRERNTQRSCPSGWWLRRKGGEAEGSPMVPGTSWVAGLFLPTSWKWGYGAHIASLPHGCPKDGGLRVFLVTSRDPQHKPRAAGLFSKGTTAPQSHLHTAETSQHTQWQGGALTPLPTPARSRVCCHPLATNPRINK